MWPQGSPSADTEAVRELFCDCNPPVPVLLAIYRTGDAIEACFDDERQSMLELTPEPWPLIRSTEPIREHADALSAVWVARWMFWRPHGVS